MTNTFGGLILILVAGILGGTVLAPMKYVRGWKWENLWLLYAACAYLIFPWLVGFLTVPHLVSVYGGVDGRTVLTTGAFGLAWGFAVVLYGVGADIVGLSLTSGIILGSSVALGSLLPLTFLPGAREGAASVTALVAVNAVMLFGVVLCAWAGHARESAQTSAAERPRNPRFRMGILICFGAGLLATLFNIALAYGAPIAREAQRLGADPFNASNAVWSLAVSLGSLPSLIYTTHKLRRNKTWPVYGEGRPLINAVLCVLMGVMWISSTVLYGSAAGMLGPLGTVIGWPIYMSAMILANNFWGWATGEWRRAGARAVLLMGAGILVQIVAMVLFGRMR
jgi:L-rhamnose-H+ transport protein